MDFRHETVLLQESIDALVIRSDGIYVDGTLGGGGHSFEIAKRLTNGKLIGIDQDRDALAAAIRRLSEFGERFVPAKSNFSHLTDVLEDLGITQIDGMLLDLGVSSYQLDNADRGFSYMHDGDLDMRMDRDADQSAYQVVNEYEEDELFRVIRDYGEENWARRIAQFIVKSRPIQSTQELVEVIKQAVPASARRTGPHPAKRTFQAIRIEVNNELGILEDVIEQCVDRLRIGGRMAIITFHSLEDRIVKNKFRQLADPCTCPPEFPRCVCGGKAKVRVITRKPIVPTPDELERNPRSRSAKLRVIEKI
ncbi:MAG: 16S rRNA (cytosine(1402)-N(4))-methyltransferase RsmH [Bacillota bacterium]|nr:16S rRNA (cytosine(1402)-N(4))-methyltransferase RsmH [Bacillota bacterium]